MTFRRGNSAPRPQKEQPESADVVKLVDTLS